MQPDEKMYYEYIAKQIEREDGLVNTRLTWTLTAQGFLLAAFGVIAKKETMVSEFYSVLIIAVPALGFMLAGSGLAGVVGAYIAINKLKLLWKIVDRQKFPRPFGGKLASRLGEMPSLVVPSSFLIVWLVLLVRPFFSSTQHQQFAGRSASKTSVSKQLTAADTCTTKSPNEPLVSAGVGVLEVRCRRGGPRRVE